MTMVEQATGKGFEGRPPFALKRQISKLGMNDPVHDDDDFDLAAPSSKFGDSYERRAATDSPQGLKPRGGLLSYSKMELSLSQIEKSPSQVSSSGSSAHQNASFDLPPSTDFALSESIRSARKARADSIRETLLRRVVTDTAPQMPSKKGSAASLQDEESRQATKSSARAPGLAGIPHKQCGSHDQPPRLAKRVDSRPELSASDRPPKMARRVDSRQSIVDLPPKMAKRVGSKPTFGFTNLDCPPKMAKRVSSKTTVKTFGSTPNTSPVSSNLNFVWS